MPELWKSSESNSSWIIWWYHMIWFLGHHKNWFLSNYRKWLESIRIPNRNVGLALPVEIDWELVMEVVEVDPLSDRFLEFYIFGLGLVNFLRAHMIKKLPLGGAVGWGYIEFEDIHPWFVFWVDLIGWRPDVKPDGLHDLDDNDFA